MLENPKNPDLRHKGSDRRTNPRYRLSPSLVEAEISHRFQARLGDLSRGGCYLETDVVLPLEAEVTVILKRGGDQIQAQARVVRALPNQGLSLSFTSMPAEEFRILESWLASFVAAKWAADQRRSQRVAAEIEVKVSGYNREGKRFTEDTKTVVISASGCLVILMTPVNRGQRVVLSIAKSRAQAECMVVFHEARGDTRHVGLAFITPTLAFWPIDILPAEEVPPCSEV